MYKIVFNSVVIPVILLVVGMALAIGLEFAGIAQVPINLILLVAAVPIFLVAAVLLYSKGEIKQYLTVTVVMLVSYIVSMIVISGVSIALAKQTLDGVTLSINPVTLALPLILSIVFTKLLVNLHEIQKETIPKSLEPTKTEEPKEVQPLKLPEENPETPEVKEPEIKTIEPEVVSEEKPLYDYDATRPEAESQPEVFFEDIMDEKPPEHLSENKTDEKPLYDYDSTRPAAESQPEVFFEDIIDDKPESQYKETEIQEIPKNDEIKLEEPKQQKPEPAIDNVHTDEPIVQKPQLEEFSPLGELPRLDDNTIEEPVQQEVIDSDQQSEQITVNETIQPDFSKDESYKPMYASEDKSFIPKLAEESRSKVVDSGGKITSIGKLLVDHRDIENIIETNALMQSVGSEATTTKIISAVAGSKTNEKLAALKEIEGIDASIIVNEAGFIQASTLDNIHKEQLIGAMASGTFGIVSSSLNKMGFQPAKDLSIESNTGSLVLHKLSDNIITVFVDPKYKLYELLDLNDILSTAPDREHKELVESIASINGLIGVILSDNKGNLLVSKVIDESKNTEKIATMLPAFYSNLGVFIKNMDYGVIRKAIISTGNEVLLFTSIGSNILMLYATLNTAMIPSDVRIQYETIINT